MAPPTADPPSSWKPYVWGFVIGAVFLTVMPLLQRRFLKAAPPIRTLSAWSTHTLDGGSVSSTSLSGHVLLVTFEAADCDAVCVERQRRFGTATRHVDDLDGGVLLLSLATPVAFTGLRAIADEGAPLWHFAEADPAMSAELQVSLDTFLNPNGEPREQRTLWAASHGIVLIDQNNAVRGFWPDDGAGRGNSINAARLLAQHGPNP